MGFFKKLLGMEEEEISEEIREARARHGIHVDETEDLKPKSNSRDDGRGEYDAWDELRNLRTNFFFGSWATRRYRRLTHHDDKLKQELEKVAREREEKERRKAQQQNEK
jgi:hypothetical protein